MKKLLSIIIAFAIVMTVSVSAFASDEEDADERIAYMDLEQADIETKAKILEARKRIIFSHSWVADGLQGIVYDRYGNIIEKVPQFSEIFPEDWDVPYASTSKNVVERSFDDFPALKTLNDEQAMVSVYSKTLELKVPSAYYVTPPFYSFETTYWYGYNNYNMTYVYTRGYDRDSDSTYKNYFNVGYTNADTGEFLGLKTKIESWDVFGITPPSNTEIEVRASMFSDNPDVTSGKWDIDIFAFCDILNDLS